MLLKFAKKLFFLFIPLGLIALTFTNCDSSGALKLVGPEVEIDLDGNVQYKAIDPNFADACIEIRLPINIKPTDIREELVNYILAQTNGLSSFALSDEVFDINKLEVSYGSCTTENVDTMPASCSGKRINEIPVGHDFKLLTYNGQVDQTFFGTNIVDGICSSL